MSRLATIKEAIKIVVAYVLDPPGWIPAWAICGRFLWLTRHVPPELALVQTAELMKSTLAIWLGYKGLRAVAAEIRATFAPPPPQQQQPAGT